MKKGYTYHLLSGLVGCCLVLIIPFISSAQNLAEDLQRMDQAYADAEQLTMQVSYEVFRNATAQEPIQVEKGQIVRRGNQSYQKIGAVETITTAEYQLVADHTHQAVILAAGVNTPTSAGTLSVEQLQTLLQLCDSVEYKAIDPQHMQYTLLIPSSEYQKITITLDRQHYWIKKMVLHYRHGRKFTDAAGAPEAPRLEMTFGNISTRKKVPQDTFAYQNFLDKSHNRYTLNKTYQHYQLINQLH